MASGGPAGPRRRTTPVRRLELVEATSEALADYGILVGTDVANAGLPIPFYEGSVVEGRSLPFVCEGEPVVRAARIEARSEVAWLERHLRMTQLFVGLGDAPFVMVLGKPTHLRGLAVPDLVDVTAFEVPAGHAVLIHQGTWHDFPMPRGRAVTILTVTSAEVVGALASLSSAAELDTGDVLKIDVRERFGVRLVVGLAEPPE